MTETFTIGQLAKLVSVGVETIRFYEKKGLITQPPRPSSGYRKYPMDTAYRLQFIQRAKELGFTLREIQELLSFANSQEVQCDAIRNRAMAKLTDIEARMDALEGIRKVLSELVQSCEENEAFAGCPILEALAHEENDTIP